MFHIHQMNGDHVDSDPEVVGRNEWDSTGNRIQVPFYVLATFLRSTFSIHLLDRYTSNPENLWIKPSLAVVRKEASKWYCANGRVHVTCDWNQVSKITRICSRWFTRTPNMDMRVLQKCGQSLIIVWRDSDTVVHPKCFASYEVVACFRHQDLVIWFGYLP